MLPYLSAALHKLYNQVSVGTITYCPKVQDSIWLPVLLPEPALEAAVVIRCPTTDVVMEGECLSAITAAINLRRIPFQTQPCHVPVPGIVNGVGCPQVAIASIFFKVIEGARRRCRSWCVCWCFRQSGCPGWCSCCSGSRLWLSRCWRHG